MNDVMTLIINAVTQRFVVHASDRLLTKQIAGKSCVHSDIENKSLIVVVKDAICIIGYTGIAYIGDVITDEWIASIITGQDLTEQFMIRQPGVSGLYLNTLLRRIEAGLASLVLPPSASYLGISVSGVRQRGRYARPFLREFEYNRGGVRSSGYMRYPRSPNFNGLSQIGDPLVTSELRMMIGKEFVKYGISAEAFRRGMVNAILRKSKLSKLVGDEIMSITITRSAQSWDVMWTFVSQRPRFAVLAGGSGFPQRKINSYFSPWVISPTGISKPSIGNGHFDHNSGNVRIRCGNKYEQDSSEDVVMAVSSLPRTPRR